MNAETLTAEDAAQWRRWREAAAEPAVDAALRSLYDHLGERIAQRGPTCWTSGRCCNFDAYGHRLYVTALEIAWTLRQLETPTPAPGGKSLPVVTHPIPTPQAIDPRGSCVFQVDKRCSIHAVRPLGCRVFFCQEGTQDWQHEVYEQMLGRLRALHDEHAVPYRYLEWRAGLREALLHGASSMRLK